MIFPRVLMDFLDRNIKKAVEILEVYEIKFLGERWWVVGPKGSGKTILHQIISGKFVADTAYEVTGIDDVTSSGIYTIRSDSRSMAIRHKQSMDFGGEFLETWEQNIKTYERFVFIYSLNDLDNSGCYSYNNNAQTPKERFSLNKEDILYEKIMNAFILAINIINDNFTNDYSLRSNKRRLLVICNKTDLWPQGFRPQFFLPYQDIIQEMKQEANALQLEKNARFKIMYEACSFTSQPRHNFNAIISKFLER